MARNKPNKDAALPEKPAGSETEKRDEGVTGVPGGTMMDPGIVDVGGFAVDRRDVQAALRLAEAENPDTLVEAKPVGMVQLVDPAPELPGVVGTNPDPEVMPPRYVVVKGGNVIVDGNVTLLREGKVLDSRSFNVKALQDVPSIVLRRLED